MISQQTAISGRSSEDDAAYYRRRAEQELDLAAQSIKPEVVRPHYELAERYVAQALKLESQA